MTLFQLRQHARAKGGAIASLALVLFVTAQLASVQHFADTRHSVCEEHGVAVHGDATAHAPAENRRASEQERAEHDAPEHDDSDAHGHEHCELLAATATSEQVDATLHVALVAHPVPMVAAATTSDRHLETSIYRFAPKNSPPVS